MLSSAQLALIANTPQEKLAAKVHADLCDDNGEITLHSGVAALAGDLIKHAAAQNRLLTAAALAEDIYDGRD